MGPVQVRVAVESEAALNGVVVVHEEDTHLVLSAPSVVHEIERHPIRVMEGVWNDRGHEVGTVVSRPSAILAVVHDLNDEPTCRPESVATALDAVYALAEKRGLARLALWPLGAVHGRMPLNDAIGGVLDALRRATPPSLETVYLLARDDSEADTRSALGHWLANLAGKE